ncbi:MAG TPA: hypothetical protein VEU55_06345 [Gemmatimonadales bacterium]|nr:hypothetical protein [Gemmatimonadales bacterium]
MRLAVLLTCLVAPLAAQSVQGRLEGRVPAAAIPSVDSLVQTAAQEGLPTEPLVQKALEGGAKHVAAPRVVAAVQSSLTQLRDAHDLLIRAHDEPPVTPSEVTTVVWALRSGLPAPVVERLVTALPRPPRAPAVHAVADLIAHRFDPDSAAELVIEAIRQGLRGERLHDVSVAVLQESQRGHTHAEALALVRAELPAVPAAPKPPRAAVVRARRPTGQEPPMK